MIDFHGNTKDDFLAEAITTATACLLCHTAAQLDGDVNGAHGVSRIPEMS